STRCPAVSACTCPAARWPIFRPAALSRSRRACATTSRQSSGARSCSRSPGAERSATTGAGWRAPARRADLPRRELRAEEGEQRHALAAGVPNPQLLVAAVEGQRSGAERLDALRRLQFAPAFDDEEHQVGLAVLVRRQRLARR